MMPKPVALIILDGWGYSAQTQNNPIHEAKTPFFDDLWQNYPHTLLDASGLAVGLPEGQMGNSEVGHITIGAGKTIDTDLVRISKAIENDQFKNNSAFIDLFNHVKKHNSILHVLGLIGPGGIHSHSDHLFAFLKTAKLAGIKSIAIHAITDGRDTPPKSSVVYIYELEKILSELNIGFITTISGRFYTMDRDKNWDRVERAEKAFFKSKGNLPPGGQKSSPSQAIKKLHNLGMVDEHIEPIVFMDKNDRSYPITKNDGVFFFNFRADRARQISKIISEKADLENLCFVTMTQYDPSILSKVAFPPLNIETTLAAEISKADLSQVHIAETEKFAHATYYLNGGRQNPHQKETHILINSRKDISTHDLAPQMKAVEITDKAIEYVNAKTPFIFINYANPDMVGHTANEQATIKAIETIDNELERLIKTIQNNGGTAFITADHGNAEISIDKNGHPHTAHTTNPVPAIFLPNCTTAHNQLRTSASRGTLADIAPTILDLLILPKPTSMTGKSLLSR